MQVAFPARYSYVCDACGDPCERGKWRDLMIAHDKYVRVQDMIPFPYMDLCDSRQSKMRQKTIPEEPTP